MASLRAPDAAIAEALRDRLASRRRAGEPFDQAWPAALEAVLALTAGAARREWAQVLSETRDAWSAGYERELSPTLATFAMLDVAPGHGKRTAHVVLC